MAKTVKSHAREGLKYNHVTCADRQAKWKCPLLSLDARGSHVGPMARFKSVISQMTTTTSYQTAAARRGVV